MRTLLLFLLFAVSAGAVAQSVTGVTPNQAYQGQALSTTITSSGLFLTGSSPQGNIQDIILKNASDSAFAISDSTNVVSSNTATTFWSLPANLATGLYSLVVRIYDNLFSGSTTDYPLNNSFTVTSALSTVSGMVYNDINHNGVRDVNETGIAGYTVRISPQGNTAITDAGGNYTVTTIPGLDTLIVAQPLDDIYEQSLPSSYILTVPYGATTGKNFGLTLDRYLTSVTPATAVVGQTISASILSRKVFQNDILTNVELRKSGTTSLIYASSYSATDTNNASASIQIPASAYTGKYDLVVVVKSLLNNHVRTFILDSALSVTGPLGLISGYAFVDSNSNGIKDGNEKGLMGQCVGCSGAGLNQSVLTDSTGAYQFHTLPVGTYTVSATNPYSYYQSCTSTATYTTPSNYSVSINQDTASKIFGLSAVPLPQYDLFIHPGWRPANPGFVRHYWIFYGNLAQNSASNAVITMQYDSTLVFDSCDRVPTTHNLATHTLTWNVGTVNYTPNWVSSWYGGWNDFNLYFTVPVSDTAGRLLYDNFTITPTSNDCDLFDNTVTDVSPVTSSHDPNEKHANPHANLISGQDSVIEYTINFQNTGTASTHFVIVKDTLDANLDYKTAIATGASAPFKFDNNLGALTFTMDPLVITDSATDEKHSHGFVSYKVKLKHGLSLGTAIHNTASIFFDYNSAVVTNTTTNVLTNPLGIRNMADAMKVVVHPNPFEDHTVLSFSNPAHDKYVLRLYDVTGNIVQTLTGSDAEFLIQRGNMASGVYMYKLTNQNTKLSAQGKISIL